MLTVRHAGIGHGKVVHHVETNGTENVTPQSNVFASVCEGVPNDPFPGSSEMHVCSCAASPGDKVRRCLGAN